VNAPEQLRTLADEQLHATIERLQRTVNCMAAATSETGLRIRLTYEQALDAARTEQERRKC
jgi:hypothetical protein